MTRFALVFGLAASLCGAVAHAQSIYRCPENLYTNDMYEAKRRGCKLMEGGNVTIVQNGPAPLRAERPAAAPPAIRPNSSSNPAVNPPAFRPATASSAEQRARDADKRLILEQELRVAQQKLAELNREFNNGQPEKRGDEARNYQKYADRVNEMKANITRAENDVNSLKRELSRLPTASASAMVLMR